MKYRFICNHGGKPRKASSASSSSSSSSISPSKKRKRDPSKMIPKVDCPAKIDLYKYSDDSYEAVYYWYHHNHDPTNSESIIASRLPEEARKWIIERVDKNMDWEAIQNALRLTRKERDYLDNNPNLLPVSELIHYKDVQNLI
ncbi:hypothetical protein BDC45DRAFT_580157 [Circinella umbellata]|nr:hypothetical protein BDC45DRAFT_580157 [Circinella umbellata]